MWSIYNAENGQQYDGLSRAEVRAIVMVMPIESRQFWVVFRAGWKQWKKLPDCTDLLSMSSMSHTSLNYQPPDINEVRSPKNFGDEPDKPKIERDDEFTESMSLPSFMNSKNNPQDEEREVAIASMDEEESSTGTEDDSMLWQEIQKKSISEITPVPVPEESEQDISIPSLEDLSQIEAPAKKPIAMPQIKIAPIHVPGISEVSDESQIMTQPVEKVEDQTKNLRKNERHSMRLSVEVLFGEKKFKTFTKDVSLGGVALEHCLPNWAAGYGTVILATVDRGYRLEFMCSVVENQKGENYRLEIYPSMDTPELRRWLKYGPPERIAK